jgi:hypothetical protein
MLNPLKDKLGDQSQKWKDRGGEIWTNLQGRQERFFQRGQEVLTDVEGNVLHRVADLFNWAYTATGGRMEVIRKGRDFFAERVTEFDEAHEVASDDGQAAEEGDGEVDEEPASVAAEAEEQATADEPAEEEAAEAAESDAPLEPPFAEYDELNVKQLSTRFTDLNAEQLEQALVYEQANKERKTVIETLERMLKD